MIHIQQEITNGLLVEYFNEFFKAIMQGRTDYENMLPMTIGIKK